MDEAKKIPRSVTLTLSTKRAVRIDLRESYHGEVEKLYKALAEETIIPAERRYGYDQWDTILEMLRDEVTYVCQPYKDEIKYAAMAMMMAGAIDAYESWKQKKWKEDLRREGKL